MRVLAKHRPTVAGLAALVRERFPNLGPVEVAQYLKDNASPPSSKVPNNDWGCGVAQLPPLQSIAPGAVKPPVAGNDAVTGGLLMVLALSGVLLTIDGVVLLRFRRVREKSTFTSTEARVHDVRPNLGWNPSQPPTPDGSTLRTVLRRRLAVAAESWDSAVADIGTALSLRFVARYEDWGPAS